ncbi:hypothetical protein [Motilibacter aurantiacus]|uniref:hypothetical protein n=1 Tax=Motilibacter aurantiacus TaxID=2714955 RepID=UPI001407ED7F|nr:hypothetical protein [Motilibacter aurantiacus]NHC46465.1 hypothetical protein [Motilibacter aurantiacus]
MTASSWDTPEQALGPAAWEALLAARTVDLAVLVEVLGDALLEHVRSPMLHRAADDAVRLRLTALAAGGRRRRDAAPEELAELRRHADAAAQKLRTALDRLTDARGQEMEPAAHAVAVLTGGEPAAACVAAQAALRTTEVVYVALDAMGLRGLDPVEVLALVRAGIAVPRALTLAELLSSRRWWPKRLREFALAGVAAGGDPTAYVACMDDLAYAQLSTWQQRAALELLGGPGSRFGLDGTAAAAEVRGIEYVPRQRVGGTARGLAG